MDTSIPICPEFETWDYAGEYATPNGPEPNQALIWDVQRNAKDELCFLVTRPGIFFPIKRLPGDREALNAVACESNCFGTSARGTRLSDAPPAGESFGWFISAIVLFLLALF